MKKWTIFLAAAVVLLLSLWGFWGEGTASKLFPEKEIGASQGAAQPSLDTKVEEPMGEEEGPVKRYDAALHVRAKPLKDPFHMEAIRKEEKPKVSATKSAPSAPAAKKQAGEKEISYPVSPLCRGIMAFGSEKRAIIEYRGESMTVKEGERAGPWKVSSIEEKKVTLTGASGTVELSTR